MSISFDQISLVAVDSSILNQPTSRGLDLLAIS